MAEAEKELLMRDGIRKQYKISFSGTEFLDITNSGIHREAGIEIEKILCDSDDIVFGCCKSDRFSVVVTAAGIQGDLVGQEMNVSIVCEDTELQLGKFIITQAPRKAGKDYKKITSYDRMQLLKVNMADWYNMILPEEDSEVTLGTFRNSFFEYLDITQKTAVLVNDDMPVRKTIDTNMITGIEIMQAVCEINGRFGHFNPLGQFEYVQIQKTNEDYEDIQDAIAVDYEDYQVEGINQLQIRMESGDIGHIETLEDVLEGQENAYIVNDNFLCYGMSDEELAEIAKKLLDEIKGISYTPAEVETVGRPWLELGKRCRLHTDEGQKDMLVLKHTLKGGQALRSLLEAAGEQYRKEEVEGLNYEFRKLKGKSNKLERTVEHTLSEVSDLSYEINGDEHKRGIKSIVEQLASQIITEIVEESGEVLSRFSQSLGKFIFEGESFEIHTENLDISGTTFSVDDGYIGAIKIGAQGLSSEDYTTLKILADGTVECKDFRANGMGHIFLTSHHANDPDEDEECYVVTEDGFHADVNKEHHTSIAMYTNPDGTGEIAWLPEEIYSDMQKPSGMVRAVFEDGQVSIRDTQGNLLPLLAQNSGGGGSSEIYSLDEQEVGTWVDGKKVCVRTFHLASISVNSSGNTVVDVAELEDVFAVMDVAGFAKDSTNGNTMTFPYVHPSASYPIGFVVTNSTNTVVKIVMSSIYSGTNRFIDCYFTIKYIKKDTAYQTTKRYLFKSGQGVVSEYISGVQGAASGRISITSEKITMLSDMNKSVEFSEQIACGQYSKLCIRCDCTFNVQGVGIPSLYCGAFQELSITNGTISGNHHAFEYISQNGQSFDGVYELDLSGISNDFYIGISSCRMNCNIYDIWVE